MDDKKPRSTAQRAFNVPDPGIKKQKAIHQMAQSMDAEQKRLLTETYRLMVATHQSWGMSPSQIDEAISEGSDKCVMVLAHLSHELGIENAVAIVQHFAADRLVNFRDPHRFVLTENGVLCAKYLLETEG